MAMLELSEESLAETITIKPFSMWDVCTGIIPMLACSPLLLAQGMMIWSSWSHRLGLVVWMVVAAIVVVRARGQLTRHLARMTLAWILFVAAVTLLGLGVLAWSFNTVHLSAALFLVSWALGRCSVRSWHEVVSWGLLLVITIPVGFLASLDSRITEMAGSMASTVLEAHGILHLKDVGQINLLNGRVSIGSVTSAKLGLYVTLCFTALWCWMRSRSLFQSILTILGGALALLLSRFFAITLVCIGLTKYDQDWTTADWPHYAISLGAFVLTLLLTLLLDAAIAAVFAPIPSTHPEHFTMFAAANRLTNWPMQKLSVIDEDEESDQVRLQLERWRLAWYSVDWHRSRWLRYSVVACSVVCLLAIPLTLLAVVRSGLVSWPQPPTVLKLADFQQSINAAVLPTDWNGFRQAAFQMGPFDAKQDGPAEVGVLDLRWIYQWQGYSVEVLVVAPVMAWQPPLPLPNSGIINSKVELRDLDGQISWPWYDCRQTNSLGGDIYVMQCCLSDELQPAKTPESQVGFQWELFNKLDGASGEKPIQMYEIRVLCESGESLSLAKLEQLQQFFKTVRSKIREQLTPGMLQKNTSSSNSR